ncbi:MULTISPECIES: hypothetical protein [Stutzerimonas stutzeri subgroup]|uniref:hypothetical protein n=1 Tax=Stutzerimonas stutzeri subgroup TaxID=578833 RepID=UPI0012EBF06C|nr:MULTISPECIES: hypothetical protein [Stutzerimonas stutzeri subgroup]
MSNKEKNQNQEKVVKREIVWKKENPTNVQVNNDNGKTTSTGPRTPTKNKNQE